ncbi:MAG: DUF1801 domain-containing protein [Ignavibacteriales bacterium]|nr:DUF1801 domain-containing protein [Ignavibacteriales bacterium]
MKPQGKTVQEILLNLPADRIEPFNKLHATIVKNLPKGFEPAISYGGLGVAPHKLYPAGYHRKPEEPLPFAGIASQKGSINLYHMGVYADPKLLKWFVNEYPKHCKHKTDMGKSCVRFKKINEIPCINSLLNYRKRSALRNGLRCMRKNYLPKSKKNLRFVIFSPVTISNF